MAKKDEVAKTAKAKAPQELESQDLEKVSGGFSWGEVNWGGLKGSAPVTQNMKIADIEGY